jgi:phosphohistidine phosphatase
MLIFFVRHASAGERKASPVQDEKRGLDQLGIEQCHYAGRFLSAIDAHVDLVVASPLKRCTQTAALINNDLGDEAPLRVDNSLRPSGNFEGFRELLRRCARMEAIMVVGHNPNISRFLSLLLTGGVDDRFMDLKKGTVARVDFSGKRSILNWMVTPKIAHALHRGAPAEAGKNAAPVKAKKVRKILKKAHKAAQSSSRPKTSRK